MRLPGGATSETRQRLRRGGQGPAGGSSGGAADPEAASLVKTIPAQEEAMTRSERAAAIGELVGRPGAWGQINRGK